MSTDTLTQIPLQTQIPIHTKVVSLRADRAGLNGLVVGHKEGSAYVAWNDYSYSFEFQHTLVPVA
jgi:hypothetical protein